MVLGSPLPNRSQTYSLKDFSYPKSSTCSADLNSGVFGKINLENTFWPNYFGKKILYCTIHMAWSLGQKFGAKKWSIEGGARIWLSWELETTDKNPIQIKAKQCKSFCQPIFYHDILT